MLPLLDELLHLRRGVAEGVVAKVGRASQRSKKQRIAGRRQRARHPPVPWYFPLFPNRDRGSISCGSVQSLT